MFYGGVEIPDSPFAMTSNPNLDDVIDAQDIGGGLGSSRKPSRLGGQDGGDDDDDDAELIYSRNGTGMQRKPTKGKIRSIVFTLIGKNYPSWFFHVHALH